MKNARHLQTTGSQLVRRDEPLEGFGSLIPVSVLSRLHLGLGAEDRTAYPQLAAVLQRWPAPKPRAVAVEPLFQGTFVFVAIAFLTSSGAKSVDTADLNTAIAFTRRAVEPISRYASQYGPNRLSVSSSPVSFVANVPAGRYNDQTLQGWIDAIARQTGLPTNPCFVVLNPPTVVNTDADPRTGVGGYHAATQVPYIFVNVMGSGLTIADAANVYALALSHEVAETAVDPRSDSVSPEVADPCGPNCQTPWIDYFDDRGGYVSTTQRFPPPFAYAFFVNAIVRPESATMCPAPGASCNYAPP